MQKDSDRVQPWLVAAFTIGWLAFAVAALELTSGMDGIAAVWPPSGIFLAGLLIARPASRIWLIGGTAAASLAANLWGEVGLLAATGFTIANLAEGMLGYTLMNRLGVNRRTFENPASLAIFGVTAIAASLASATMAAVLSGKLDIPFFLSWASTVALGMLIVTPVILFLLRPGHAGAGGQSSLWIWTVLLVGGCTVIAFGQADYPLLFLPMVAVLFATLMHGLRGTAIAILAVTAVGSILTVLDRGPVSLFFGTVEEQVLYFQLYLVALLLSVFPLAALLARHRKDLFQITHDKRKLEEAERIVRFGHFHYRKADDLVEWSVTARDITGRKPERTRGLASVLECYHENDRERVNGAIETILRTGLPSNFEARLVRPDGSVRKIEGRTEAGYDEEGEICELIGTMRDVTDGYSFASRFADPQTPDVA
ncbi:MASE1 domain-containing protein [Erythrobacteraceae bacterium WH01K]|nr:MASE1 domain-containing protein [Erythrobacteraceae bacterium WH01K]